MTPYNIALLFCRLLAIFLVGRFFELFAIGALSAFSFLIFNPPSSEWRVIAVLLAPAGYLATSIVLWLGAPLIALSVARGVEFSTPVTASENSARQWDATLKSFLGIYFVILGVSGCGAGLIGLLLTGNGIVNSRRVTLVMKDLSQRLCNLCSD
jgi:hypothetical protein